jgi:hypothetical protein
MVEEFCGLIVVEVKEGFSTLYRHLVSTILMYSWNFFLFVFLNSMKNQWLSFERISFLKSIGYFYLKKSIRQKLNTDPTNSGQSSRTKQNSRKTKSLP